MDAALEAASTAASFGVLRQKLHLDFSFFPRRVTGKATLHIQPHSEHLRYIKLHCRQLQITRVRVEGRDATGSKHYSNLYDRLALRPGTDIHQYILIKDRIRAHSNREEEELEIVVPDQVKIRRMNPEDATVDQVALNAFGPGGDLYTPLKVEIEYVLENPRDALHYVGVEDGDARYPHVFTRNSPHPGVASSLFPCIDDGATKCIFDVSIRYPRTLGDLYNKGQTRVAAAQSLIQRDSSPKADSVMSDVDDDPAEFTDEEKALEMAVICSGELTDDISDPDDPSRKTASFSCAVPVLPQHIGIALGPFCHVDLSEYRDTQDDERLGSNAIRVHAFCLPGREDEVRNSAMMLARTLDSFTEKYQSYPFEKAYKLAFVDDLERDVAHSASFSICSSRLLFPEDVWEPQDKTTRVLVHAVASQWIGVNVTPARLNDYWVIEGASWFMTELYMTELVGRNDLRFRQREMVQKILELDIRRPSLFRLGEYMHVDPGETEFMEMKSVMVLAILHHRLVKQSGKNGVDRCLWRLLFNARNEKLKNGLISTEAFLDICEKVGHQKLDAFFNQWVFGSGCPQFECHPQFNKKKQVIQLTIKQTQADPAAASEERPLAAADMLRESKEKANGFRADSEWPAFVGPMTIRIHEADGTPYEHIVDINSSTVKVEIPYNTKYKRLKKNRRERERAAAAQGQDANGEIQEDTVLYMFGDRLDSKEQMEEWKISEWGADDEARMDQEFYEWLRVDADFEWICRANIIDMPAYMYVSQLQQDKDVMAQAESIQWLAGKEGHPLISSILLRTLMDDRYFHAIRVMAAHVMVDSAKAKTNWIGFFHLRKAFESMYCIPGSPMTMANDFSDRIKYIIQCAIPSAIARIKDTDGKTPMFVKKFILDLVRYNNNRGNEFSDDYYMATLMKCLTQCLTTLGMNRELPLSFEEREFQQKALDELSRHQRLDEWIPTYQNIFTTTALDCSLVLMRNKVIPLALSDFMQYTRTGNADNVRLTAWDCLVQLGAIRNPHMVKYMIHSIATDPSPYFRASLIQRLDVALGQVAVGAEFKVEEVKAHVPDTGLIEIEKEEDQPNREAMRARQKLEGAQRALKAELEKYEALKTSLEKALHSKTTSVSDVSELLEICQLLYTSKYSCPVTLQLPKYMRCEHIGNGVVRFFPSKTYRTQTLEQILESLKPKPKPQVPLVLGLPTPAPTQTAPLSQEAPYIPPPAPAPVPVPTAAAPAPVPAPAPKIKLKFKAPSATPKPLEPERSKPEEAPRPKAQETPRPTPQEPERPRPQEPDRPRPQEVPRPKPQEVQKPILKLHTPKPQEVPQPKPQEPQRQTAKIKIQQPKPQVTQRPNILPPKPSVGSVGSSTISSPRTAEPSPRPSPAPGFRPGPLNVAVPRPSPRPSPSPAGTPTNAQPPSRFSSPKPMPSPKPRPTNIPGLPSSAPSSRAPTPLSVSSSQHREDRDRDSDRDREREIQRKRERAERERQREADQARRERAISERERERERERSAIPERANTPSFRANTPSVPSPIPGHGSLIAKPTKSKIRIQTSKKRKIVVLKVAPEKLRRVGRELRDPNRVPGTPSKIGGGGGGVNLKRKAVGEPDGHDLKRASVGVGGRDDGAPPKKRRCIVKLRIGRKNCRELREKGMR